MASYTWMISAGLLLGSLSFHTLNQAQSSNTNYRFQSNSSMLSHEETEQYIATSHHAGAMYKLSSYAIDNATLTAHRGSGRNCATTPCP